MSTANLSDVPASPSPLHRESPPLANDAVVTSATNGDDRSSTTNPLPLLRESPSLVDDIAVTSVTNVTNSSSSINHPTNPLLPHQTHLLTTDTVAPTPKPRPRPRPAYARALDERAALEARAHAELEAAVADKPLMQPLLTKMYRPAYTRELEERAVAEVAAATLVTPAATPPPPRPAKQPKAKNHSKPDVPAVPIETGPRVRRLTELGLQREKALEAQRAKADLAALRKAEREKKANKTAPKKNTSRSKKGTT
jgi:hypothetical protein